MVVSQLAFFEQQRFIIKEQVSFVGFFFLDAKKVEDVPPRSQIPKT
jgi:hypothetical protein